MNQKILLISLFVLSGCAQVKTIEDTHKADSIKIAAISKVYKSHADLIKAEKDRCIQNKDGWHWENVNLNEEAFVIERKQARAKAPKRTYANLLCLSKVREEQNILRLARVNELLSQPNQNTDENNSGYAQRGVLVFKVFAYDQGGGLIPLLPAKRIITNEAATDFIQFKEQPVQDTLLVIEVSDLPATHVIKTGQATVDSSVPIYGAGTMMMSNTFKYKVYPLQSGKVRGEWVSKDSDFFKKAELIND